MKELTACEISGRKSFSGMCQRFIKFAFGNVDNRDQPLACINQDNPRGLLVEKLDADAG
jgi:hypothetical protein